VLADDVPLIVKHAGERWDLLARRATRTNTTAER